MILPKSLAGQEHLHQFRYLHLARVRCTCGVEGNIESLAVPEAGREPAKPMTPIPIRTIDPADHAALPPTPVGSAAEAEAIWVRLMDLLKAQKPVSQAYIDKFAVAWLSDALSAAHQRGYSKGSEDANFGRQESKDG